MSNEIKNSEAFSKIKNEENITDKQLKEWTKNFSSKSEGKINSSKMNR